MLFDLTTIGEDGKNFNFDELSDEVMGAFKDLIGETPFKISFNIRTLGNTWQVLGEVQTQYPEVCSKCGYDIELNLNSRINEIIVLEKARPRNTAVSQSQQNFDSEGPSVTYINDSTINLNEFLHEMMAAGFALYPKCQDEPTCEARQFRDPVVKVEPQKGHPGFAALKDLKVSKH